MTTPVWNAARNSVRNAPCNTVTNDVRTRVQNQNQNQRFWLLQSVVGCGDEFIHRQGLLEDCCDRMDGGFAAWFLGGVRCP